MLQTPTPPPSCQRPRPACGPSFEKIREMSAIALQRVPLRHHSRKAGEEARSKGGEEDSDRPPRFHPAGPTGLHRIRFEKNQRFVRQSLAAAKDVCEAGQFSAAVAT